MVGNSYASKIMKEEKKNVVPVLNALSQTYYKIYTSFNT
jgi:hypothetical protein